MARFVLDTCVVIDWSIDHAIYAQLYRLYSERRIFLAKTDVLDTELDPSKLIASDPKYRISSELLELHGPAVLDYSRIGHSVTGSLSDKQRLEEIRALVTGTSTSKRRRKHDERDAMHISTAIRYGFDGMITEDRRLLKLNNELHRQFGFRVVTGAIAVALIEKLIERQERRRLLGLAEATTTLEHGDATIPENLDR